MSERGAVLAEAEIKKLCKPAQRPLMHDCDEGQLHGAKYDLRLADTGMALASGTIVKPSDPPRSSLILLEPGETILVSTKERLCMPCDMVANISIKGDLSREGILSLTGLIVDPGYETGPSGDGRVHFRLANLGRRAVALKPGETAIASIQFLRLSEKAKPPPPFADLWARPEQLQEGLGFIDDLRRLTTDVESLKSEFENQRRAVDYVAIGGVVLLVVTLLGVAVSALLSLGSDSGLVDSAKNVIPNDGRGQILFVIGIFGVAAVIAAVIVATARARRPSPELPGGHRLLEQEAVRDLRISRWQGVSLAAAGAVVLTYAAVAAAIALFNAAAITAVAVGLVAGLLCTALILGTLWRPVTLKRIDERLREWHQELPN